VPSPGVSGSLQSLWYRRSRPLLGLRLLASLYGGVTVLRRAAYAHGWLKSHRVGCPVIVVGNVVVGGTGKTPLVIWLVEQLRARGYSPGVVLRGFGGRAARLPRVVQPDSDPREVGDEAVLLRLRTGGPVVVGTDRVQAAQRLLQEGVDAVIADDGLQHLRLRRDFEIAVVDGIRGLGNGYLLPAGPLREPSARLRSVDCVVVNGGPGGDPLPLPRPPLLMTLEGEQLQPLAGNAASMPLQTLAGQPVHAVAGIGHPARFFAQLARAGLQVFEHPFPDHHEFRPSDLQFDDGLPVLMTEKDAVKCRRFATEDCWYLPVAASFTAEQGSVLLDRLQPLLRR
jgi:tetraacyldisaccharide 4'-kinase